MLGSRGLKIVCQVRIAHSTCIDYIYSPIPGWSLEDSRRAARPIPLQKPQHWLREPDIPPQHRRAVRHLHLVASVFI